VDRLQKQPKAVDRQWVKWLEGADILIADEIFGARNEKTIYGRLLRPKAQSGRMTLWRRRRPRLIGLSATLLSRDLSDAQSIFRFCLDWRRPTETNGVLYDHIEQALKGFSHALRIGLKPNSAPQMRQYLREYKRQKTVLEKLLPHLIVRTITQRPRSYRFAPGGHNNISLFSFPKTDSTMFPINGQIKNLLTSLQCQINAASDAPQCLKWFISEAKRPTSQPNGRAKQYPAWTAVTESYRRTDQSIPNETHPKLGSLRLWIEAYYKECESDWLLRTSSMAPHFKLLVYVHHVRTATALNPRSRSRKSTGKALRQQLRKLMLSTCKSVARRNPELFRNKNLELPVKGLQGILERKGWDIGRLKRTNRTLLLAACINAHKGRNRRDKLDRFKKTLEDSGIEQKGKSYRQVLRRYPELRRIILERIGYAEVLAFEARLRKDRGKLELTPSVAVLDPDSLDLPADDKKLIRLSLDRMEEQFRPLTLPHHLAKKETRPQLKAIAEKIKRLIEKHTSWGAQIADFGSAPYRNLEKIRRQLQKQHRIPWELAIQTGEESKSRNFVADSFRTVGNPFVLVLTNVCTVGVDLHTYCWDVLHYTPAWTPHEAEQKTGRIDRPRLQRDFEKLQIASEQDCKRISVHHLIWPHTYDERILSRLNLRAQLSERLLGTKHQDSLEETSELSATTSLPQFRPLDLQPPSR
jgi:hypothetical protein